MAEFNASGSALIYSTYIGGSGYDVASSIALDATGNAYVAGYNYAAGFPTTQGAYQTATRGLYDGFITKLNASGSALVYSTYLGGTGMTMSWVSVSILWAAYVTGHTISSDFPMQNAQQPTFGGYYDAFVTKLNPACSALAYSTYLGGIGFDAGRGIAVDSLGNAYVAGQTGSNNFPTTPGAYQNAYGGSDDAFVTKINASGAVVYCTYLGGSGGDTANAIAVDQSGSAYVTGNNLTAGSR